MGAKSPLGLRFLIPVILISIVSTFEIEFRPNSDRDRIKLTHPTNPPSSIKKSIPHHLTPYNGLIIDKPKIRILSYRLRNKDPWDITDELSCTGGKGTGGRGLGNCDELVEVEIRSRNDIEDIPKRLGQAEGETGEWSLPPNVTQLTVECQSKLGPVEWDYLGKGIFPDIDIETTRQTEDFWTATTYTHLSQLTFRTVSDQLTGTFTCRNVEKPSVSNSFYVFVPQEKQEIFELDKPLEIIPRSHDTSVVIPCLLEDKEVPINLFRKITNESFQPISPRTDEGVSFDPYVGFRLEITPEVYGSYICNVDKDKEDLKRRKRDLVKETSTSPGIPAFPTSEELASLLTPNGHSLNLKKSQKSPEETPSSAETLQSSLNFQFDESLINPSPVDPIDPNVLLRRRLKRRRKRPFLRRRVGVGQRPGPGPEMVYYGPGPGTGGSGEYTFTRRGGPPPVQQFQDPTGHGSGPLYGPRPIIRLRPAGPGPRPFRRPGYPFGRPRYPPPPQHSAYHFGSLPLPIPEVSEIDLLEKPQVEQSKGNDSNSNSETPSPDATISDPASPQPLPQDPYFYPSPIMPSYPHPHPQPLSKPINVLPTFINKLGQKLRPPSSEEKTSSNSNELKFPSGPGYGEQINIEPKYSNKSRPISSLNKPPRRGAAALLSQNLLPQTMNIMNSMTCVLKKVMLGPEASCNGSLLDASATALSRRPGPGSLPGGQFSLNFHDKIDLDGDKRTILEVDLLPPPVNKFFPKETILYTTVPFFVKWQTRSTDFANWAEVNHTLKQGTYKLHKAGHFEDNGVHSFEVFNLGDGDNGKISVPFVSSTGKILVHTWKFFVINTTTYTQKGMTYKEEGNSNVFTCRSATVNKPKLTLTKLSEDGCALKQEAGASLKRNKHKLSKLSKKNKLTEEDCGPGCFKIKTEIEDGLVHCSGDGVEEQIRFPKDLYCTGRPYFIERGKTRNLTLTKQKLNIPCIINNPNADVYLFHQMLNGTVEEVTDHTTYDLKLGFSLNLEKIEPLGTYFCTSTTNLEDGSDMVTYVVNPAPSYVFNPPYEKVLGSPPFRFVWESVEELEVENKSIGSFYSGVFANPEGNRPYVGTFEISSKSMEKGQKGEVRVLRSKDKQVVHTWKYTYKGKFGLWVDKKTNVFKCKSTSEVAPSLFAVECSNPNVCKFKKQFVQHDGTDRDNVECGPGCTELKIWKNKPFGFVSCKGDGVDDTLNYFLSQNSTLLTETDNLERFKQIEITSIVRKLRVGDSIKFVCKANKYFYSKGFQWAIETKNGSKRFIDATNKDVDSYLNEIRSEVSLKVGPDWKAVWCHVPLIDSNQWGNASQLIYIK